MPLFEYACRECGRTDEHLVRTPAPDGVPCSVCGAEAHRVVPLLARSSGNCAPTSSSGRWTPRWVSWTLMFSGLDIPPNVFFFVGLVVVGVLFLRDGGTW